MKSDLSLDRGAGPVISVRVRKTIQSIKEIVGNHSDADVYAVLKETNMDPNETAQRLLNQEDNLEQYCDEDAEETPVEGIHEDPFHEVRRRRNKRKEFTGYKAVDIAKSTEYITWGRSNRSMNFSVRRGDIRINKEFRIVRDFRVSQDANKDANSQPLQRTPGNEHNELSISDKRFMALLPEELGSIIDSATSEPQIVLPSSYLMDSSSISTTSGVCSSSSNPVHAPSPASRSAGAVGVIPVVIGAVGVRKQPSAFHASNKARSNNSQSMPLIGKANSSSKGSLENSSMTRKSSQPNLVPSSDNAMPTMANSRYASVQYNSKQHLQAVNHQRAVQPNMEWKPKKRKPRTGNSSTVRTSSILPLSDGNYRVDDTDLSDKLLHAHIYGDQRVIIPQHLRVPESECMQLTFGSFGAGSDSSKTILPAHQTIESSQRSNLETSVSNSPSVPVGHNGKTSAEVEHFIACEAGTSRSTLHASVEELDRKLLGNDEPLNSQNIESYASVGLVGSHSLPYTSQPAQQIQDIASVPNFPAFDSPTSYVVPFFPTILEDNVCGQTSASSLEARSSYARNNNVSTTFVITQQNQASQQHQQAQIYPHVHIPHYANFMPYRQVFPPVYGPPMGMANYSSNPAYPHPSSGNNYLLMPCGSSHLPAIGMKYAPSQYKPVHTGSPSLYGRYSTPPAFAIGIPSSMGGATASEDMTRIKYKDNNPFVPNQQAEGPDMWIHNPRELPGLQSTPYYNLPGHAAHSASFVAGQSAADAAAVAGGNPSLNAIAAAVPLSSAHFPAVYHTPQPASITPPHPLVHQQVPAAISLGATGGQVGTFQQPHIGHLNWTANF